MTTLLHQSPPARVLAVAAHPDDIEFYAGGTLATWIAGGSQVHYLLVTDGSSGSRDPACTTAALARRRRVEQQQAAALLGVTSVTFLGYPDAAFDPCLELRLAIARVIRQVRPDAVLTFDPNRHYHATGINHPDHIAVGASTLGAVMPLANTLLAAPTLAAEGLVPHDVAQVYLFETAAPTAWMPVDERALSRKLTALAAHASQMEVWDGVGAACAHGAGLAQTVGVACGHAEVFARIQLAAPEPSALLHLPAHASQRERQSVVAER